MTTRTQKQAQHSVDPNCECPACRAARPGAAEALAYVQATKYREECAAALYPAAWGTMAYANLDELIANQETYRQVRARHQAASAAEGAAHRAWYLATH